MPSVLIINPNTSTHVTELLLSKARSVLPTDWGTIAVTAPFGAAYISSEAGYAIAGHAVLEAYASAGAGTDAVLVGCFGDPGLHALREIVPCPVVGLAEASMLEANLAGNFSIITGGERWAPMLRRLAAGLGLDTSLRGIHFVRETGAELAADPARALEVLAGKCREAMEQDHPASLIVGGAALAGMGEQLAQKLGLPVIDSVAAAFRAVRARAGIVDTRRVADGISYSGISLALERVLSTDPAVQTTPV